MSFFLLKSRRMRETTAHQNNKNSGDMQAPF